MVEVHQAPGGELNQGLDVIGQFGQFLGDSWLWLLMSIIICIVGIVIYMILKKNEDERRERDDIIYEQFKNTIRDCRLGAMQLMKTPMNKTFIKKKWRLINLLWLGLPFVKHELSSKVLNYRNDIVGYWRGHTVKMEGTMNILVYIDKSLIFFENTFVIKCPLYLPIKTKVIDVAASEKENKTVYKTDKIGNDVTEEKLVPFNDYVEDLPNGDIKIYCTHLEKIGFYRVPVYITKNKDIIDLRKELNDRVVQSGYDSLITRVLSTGAKQVEKAMEHNPYLKFEQKLPEKTVNEKREEDNVS